MARRSMSIPDFEKRVATLQKGRKLRMRVLGRLEADEALQDARGCMETDLNGMLSRAYRMGYDRGWKAGKVGKVIKKGGA